MKKKMVFGIGVNDANYQVRHRIGEGEKRVVCPYYRVWYNMLMRCYSQVFHDKNPSYIGCSVATEWLNFMTFKSWMELEDWRGNQLDKDLIEKGNRIYSPSTCIFISQAVNKFLVEREDKDGLPHGVYFHKRDSVYVSYSGKRYLGSFQTIESANSAYRLGKHEDAIKLASLCKPRVSDLILKRYTGD